MTSPTIDNPLALDSQVCFALAIASRDVIGLYRPILEPLGLTHPQYLVLLALWDESPRTLKGLGQTLHLEPATLSPLLKRLEATGYVRRHRREADERTLDITLTDRGLDLRAVAETIPPRVVEALNLPLDDLLRLRDALHRVIAATS
ncbi:MarR family transcriptional regulator [Cryobacterium suzukii]|uniref:MarR family transcriptional regulator n=1 Tax=Cryobacterium suzukii TaxID=1259198 RepID=A0A4R9AEM9_9MICO|nr:MarR family transcriptional regulator [Cryobacterium suzukii]TFD59824.1 MarR family transcriptional regulator [Cryobacterium suzukii]